MLSYAPLFYALFFINYVTDGQRVSDQIYVNLDANVRCFRLLNGTHQIGCQSKEGGNTGIIHIIRTESDVEWIENDPGDYGDFVAVVTLEIFSNREVMIKLKDFDHVTAIIVLWPSDTKQPDVEFSADYKCPNFVADQKGKCNHQWNKYGTHLWFEDWTKPIFLVSNETEIEIIRDSCFNQFNKPTDGKTPREYPLCAATLTFFQQGVKDTPTCLRRSTLINGIEVHKARFCDALAAENVIGFIPTSLKDVRPFKKKSALLLASRMDSFSMFTQNSPGAEAALTGVVSMLSVAEAVGRAWKQLEASALEKEKFLVLALFHGESLDYIGSSRMIYDMLQGRFPFELKDGKSDQLALLSAEEIGFFLELNQIGLTEQRTFHAHADPTVYKFAETEIKQIVDGLSSQMQPYTTKLISDIELPPSSYRRFLVDFNKTAGIVLSDFEQEFSNKYYNSFLDRSYQFSSDVVDDISNASNAVFKVAASWLGITETDVQVDRDVVKELYDCFIASKTWIECPLFERIFSTKYENWQSLPAWERTYIGVPNPHSSSLVQYLSHELMSWYLGAKLDRNTTQDQCKAFGKETDLFTFDWSVDYSGKTNNSFCINSSVHKTPAASPAFIIEDYDWSSGQYPSWTESVWVGASFRLFLVPPPSFEIGVFCGGLAVLLLSAGLVWLLMLRSDLLFEKPPQINGN